MSSDGQASATKVGEDRACPICGSAACSPLPQYSRDPWRVVACSDCGFVYLRNAPDYDALIDEFAYEKTWQEEKKRRKKRAPVLMALDQATRWRLTAFKPDLAKMYRGLFPPGRVLDVGCGPGNFIPEPFEPYGIEISDALHKEADAIMRKRGGYAVHAPGAEGIAHFPDKHFSGIILASILEHEKNPRRMLEETRRVLADNGVVYLKVPNFGGANRPIMGGRWCGFRHPDHVNYFTPASLKRLARETGFAIKHTNPLAVFDDNIHAVLTKA